MSIKAKLTAVAIATVSSVFSFSVPSQAGEYEYLNELEKTPEYASQQESVNRYLDNLSDSQKLERGKSYCKGLEYLSVDGILKILEEAVNQYTQEGMPNQIGDALYEAEAAMVYASVKGLCPEYKYKIDNFVSEDSEEEEEI
jgi:hypothetical protein